MTFTKSHKVVHFVPVGCCLVGLESPSGNFTADNWSQIIKKEKNKPVQK